MALPNRPNYAPPADMTGWTKPPSTRSSNGVTSQANAAECPRPCGSTCPLILCSNDFVSGVSVYGIAIWSCERMGSGRLGDPGRGVAAAAHVPELVDGHGSQGHGHRARQETGASGPGLLAQPQSGRRSEPPGCASGQP